MDYSDHCADSEQGYSIVVEMSVRDFSFQFQVFVELRTPRWMDLKVQQVQLVLLGFLANLLVLYPVCLLLFLFLKLQHVRTLEISVQHLNSTSHAVCDETISFSLTKATMILDQVRKK